MEDEQEELLVNTSNVEEVVIRFAVDLARAPSLDVPHVMGALIAAIGALAVLTGDSKEQVGRFFDGLPEKLKKRLDRAHEHAAKRAARANDKDLN